MTQSEVPLAWSRRFGLALAPLFEAGETVDAEEHHVLLDSGYGTFALSTSDRELWREADPASWAWSGDIPHHVTVTPSKVALLRWDRPHDPRVFRRVGVERGLDRFYEFLMDDRLRSTKTVVDHLLSFFRRVRSLSHAAQIPDVRTTDVFLAALAKMIQSHEAQEAPGAFGLAEDAFELLGGLNPDGISAATDEVSGPSRSLSLLQLNPALAVRHAGGQLFQEAHFELLRAPTSVGLFGFIEDPEVRQTRRGGTHYTPPALARVLVEQALSALTGVTTREALTLCDPACGSGAFLHEALRALRRIGYDGHLTIIGQDISEAAVAMARFALRMSLRDWAPRGGFDLQLRAGDSLGELGIPQADITVMNPPFVSFGAQTEQQREQLKEAIGSAGTARGDLSMAFVVRALEVLNAGGVLGTLFPASLLSSKAGTSWRWRLADAGDIRLLASIGDFGLFTYAQVQTACAVIRKEAPRANSEFTALVTGNDTRATGEALRWLRKVENLPPATPVSDADWWLFPVPSAVLKERSTWRFPSPGNERALHALREAQVSTIAELFDVHQGIQTGLNEAFLLTQEEWRRLPSGERRYFRLATMTDSIQNGLVVRPYRLFFPHTTSGPLFANEALLRGAVPTYFKLFLEPHRERLAARAAIRRANRFDWWGLMHHREKSFSDKPRIISKFFGAEGAFVCDYDAAYLVVMGHLWLPRDQLKESNIEALDLRAILAAYVALFNSSPFVKLLEIFAPHVAGGQFDLSQRHVAQIPTPDLRELSLDPERGRVVSELAKSGGTINLADPSWRSRNNELVTSLYGSQIIADL
jgi:adenine-specific DNA-methyltransferase